MPVQLEWSELWYILKLRLRSAQGNNHSHGSWKQWHRKAGKEEDEESVQHWCTLKRSHPCNRIGLIFQRSILKHTEAQEQSNLYFKVVEKMHSNTIWSLYSEDFSIR